MATSRPCECNHLNAPQRKMVFLSSFTIPNDNSGGHQFFYDRQPTAPFSVPQGWSFIVTDIIVYASPLAGPLPDPSRYILAMVAFTNGALRHW